MATKINPKPEFITPGTTGGNEAAHPAAPAAAPPEFTSVPYPTVFHARNEYGAAVLNERALSRILTAMASIQTLTSILQQREADTECDGDGRLVFDARVATGITSAIACCAELVTTIIEPCGFDVVKAYRDGGDADRMNALAREIWLKGGAA